MFPDIIASVLLVLTIKVFELIVDLSIGSSNVALIVGSNATPVDLSFGNLLIIFGALVSFGF